MSLSSVQRLRRVAVIDGAFRVALPRGLLRVPKPFGICNRRPRSIRDDQKCTLRHPRGTDAWRIEHRLAGADANPYLLLASMLAGVYRGLTKKSKPIKEAIGDDFEADGSLPLKLFPSLEAMKESKLIEMQNKVKALTNVVQQMINEMTHLRELSIGTLETIKLMPDYKDAIDALKKQMEKNINEKKKADQNGTIEQDTK